eukprot:5068126-Pyramimonas_sp.AAC.2
MISSHAARAAWLEIMEERCMFDRKERQAKALEAATKETLLALYDRHLAPQASARCHPASDVSPDATVPIVTSRRRGLYRD